MTKLTPHEVRVLKMWSKEGRSAKAHAKRSGRPPQASTGLNIPQENYSGRACRAFDSLRELGLLKTDGVPILGHYYTPTDTGFKEIEERWP